MNKRQRKKRVKKMKEKLAREMRKGLSSSFIGKPLSPSALQKMSVAVSGYLRQMLSRRSIAEMIFDVWDPEPPFRYCRDDSGIVHRTGMRPPRNGITYCVRFCDHEVALASFETSDVVVTCLRCIVAA